MPRAAGVASALGLLTADARFDVTRTLVASLHDVRWEQIDALFEAMEADGRAQVQATGLQGDWTMRRLAEVRYAGQGHELSVEVPAGRLGPAALESIAGAHAAVYSAHYGYAEPAGTPLEATNWRLEISCAVPAAAGAALPKRAGGSARKGERSVYIPERGGFIPCPVYDRYALAPDEPLLGPALVEERETTVMLLPGDRAAVDGHGNLVIDIERSA